MSPYLFALAMEYLNRSLKQLRHVAFKYHLKCANMKLVHIFAAVMYHSGLRETVEGLIK